MSLTLIEKCLLLSRRWASFLVDLLLQINTSQGKCILCVNSALGKCILCVTSTQKEDHIAWTSFLVDLLLQINASGDKCILCVTSTVGKCILRKKNILHASVDRISLKMDYRYWGQRRFEFSAFSKIYETFFNVSAQKSCILFKV